MQLLYYESTTGYITNNYYYYKKYKKNVFCKNSNSDTETHLAKHFSNY